MYLGIKALHVVAIISWMAGLLHLPRLFVYHCKSEKGDIGAILGHPFGKARYHALDHSVALGRRHPGSSGNVTRVRFRLREGCDSGWPRLGRAQCR